MGVGAGERTGGAGNEEGNLPKPTEEMNDELGVAYSIQMEAAGVGFDWGEVSGPLAKLHEELAETTEAIAGNDPIEVMEELGDLLFSVVNLSRLAGVNPSMALRNATMKFERRFERVRQLAQKRGLPIPGASLDEMDLLWEEVKKSEREGSSDRKEETDLGTGP